MWTGEEMNAIRWAGTLRANKFEGDGSLLTGVASPPGGSSGAIQFNANGSFGGSNNLFYNPGDNTLTLGSPTKGYSDNIEIIGSSPGFILNNTSAHTGAGSEWAFSDGSGCNDGDFVINDNYVGAVRLLITADTGFLGIGTSITPVADLDVNKTAGGILTLRRNNSSITANDMVGKIQFYAKDSSTSTNFIVADLEAQAINTITTDINPGRLIFRTTGTGVAETPTERFRITEQGYIGIGTTVPDQQLTVNGVIGLAKATAPTISLLSSSGALFVSSAELWYKGGAGTLTRLGAA